MPSSHTSLFTLVRQFNLAPASYVDASWLPPGWPTRLAEPGNALHARTSAALSRWLLQQHGLVDQFDFDFAARAKRLALIDAPGLHALARYLGLAVYARCLRRVVERGARAALVRHIGAEAYEFVLRGAAPIAGEPAARIDTGAADLDAQLLATGRARLLDALAEPALKRRVQLKLPRSPSAGVDAAAQPAAHAPALRALLTERLIPEVTPQWAWLF